MQLENHVRRYRDVVVLRVDYVEHVTVPRDFSFVAGSRLGFVSHEFAQALVGRRDVLDAVRCACRLDLRPIAQPRQCFRASAAEEPLLALTLLDHAECRYDFGGHQLS